MTKPVIGFIGLGIMGRPMARNIMKGGYALVAFNRTKASLEEIVRDGATPAPSPKAVAEAAEIIITMVSDSPDVEEMVLGPNGIIHGAKKNAVVIDMSSINPVVTRQIAARLKEKGVHMLDAPVSGGEKSAVSGRLAIMVGGDETVFNRCKPVLETMGQSVVLCGESGAGHTVKLCNQIVGGMNMVAVCEALILCVKNGVDPRKMVEAIKKGSAGSWQLENRTADMINRNFKAGFFAQLMQKDFTNVLDNAKELKVPLPFSSLLAQMLSAVAADGNPKEDYISVLRVLEKMAGITVGPVND